jgi:hypothetical protein
MANAPLAVLAVLAVFAPAGLPVLVIGKDALAPAAAAHQMIDGGGILEARPPGRVRAVIKPFLGC